MRRGDTLVSTVRTYLRAVWTVDIDPARLVASTGIAVISPRPAIHPRFMSWYLQSDPFIDKMVARSVGVSYPAINPADLGRLIVQFPPLSEQRWIASFLDDEISRIDALIARRRRMLELLSERATATITSDFGSRIGLSAAGIPDSVGQHPMVRLGAVSTVQSGLTLDAGRELDDSAVSRPYLRVANVQDGRVDLSETREVDVPLRLATRCELSRTSSAAARYGAVRWRDACIRITSSRCGRRRSCCPIFSRSSRERRTREHTSRSRRARQRGSRARARAKLHPFAFRFPGLMSRNVSSTGQAPGSGGSMNCPGLSSARLPCCGSGGGRSSRQR